MNARILILTLFVFPLLRSQGTTAGFGAMELPFAARNASMAEGVVADQTNRLSALINPSLLAGAEAVSISLSHQSWIQDVRSNFLFVTVPISAISAGVSVATTSVGGIEVRNAPGPPIGIFDAHTATIAGTVAYQIVPELAVGAAIKHVYEKIYVDEATSLLFDVGAVYHTPLEGLSGGVSIQHLGLADKLREESAPLPTQTHFGISYETRVDEFRILGVLSGTARSVGGRFHARAGAECTYARLVSLRFGYQSGYEARGISGGLGLVQGGFSFDYGYVPFSLGIGTGHLLTLGYQF